MATPMKTWQWVIATLMAGFGLGLSIISFGVGYTYSRVEGTKIERKVQTLEEDAKKDRKMVYETLRKIDSRLSNIEGRLGAKEWHTKLK